MPQDPTFIAEKKRIARRLNRMERDIASHVARFRRDHSRVTAEAMRDLIRRIETDAIVHIRAATRGLNAEFIEARMHAHAADARANVPRFLRSAATADVTHARMRRDVGTLLRGAVPGLRSYDLKLKDVGGLKSLASDARRLLVTEGFIAAREETLDSLDPTRQYQWELSPLHKQYDECDEIARAGPYFPWEWPDAPHPHCGCGPGDSIGGIAESRVSRGTSFEDDDESQPIRWTRADGGDYLDEWRLYNESKNFLTLLSAAESTALGQVSYRELNLTANGINGRFVPRDFRGGNLPTIEINASHSKKLATIAHESAHALDAELWGNFSNSSIFRNATEKDRWNVLTRMMSNPKLAASVTNRTIYENTLSLHYGFRQHSEELFADLYTAIRFGMPVRGGAIPAAEIISWYPKAAKLVREKIESVAPKLRKRGAK